MRQRDDRPHSGWRSTCPCPPGPGGSRKYRRAIVDHRADADAIAPLEMADPNAALLFDGVFLHRAELQSYWDLRFCLDAPFETSNQHMALRDGTQTDVGAMEKQRYVGRQEMYLRTCEPQRWATIVMDIHNPTYPAIIAARQLECGRCSAPRESLAGRETTNCR